MKLLSALFLICVATALADDPPNAGFANCDFEQGVAGWGVWYSDDPKAVMTRYPYAADSAVAHGGRQSLKIVAPDENGCAFVTRGSTAMKAGARYEVGYWFRKSPELDERAFHVRFNFRPADKTKADWKMKSVEVLPTRRKTEGKWQYRAGCVRVPKDAGSPVSIGLYLKQARGTIWIDDVQIREVKAGENLIADLWVYDPYRVELGGAPLKKFGALKERNDPILARAARYNETLVKSAFVKEDVRRCLRIRQLWPKANKLDGSVSSATAPHPAPLPANAGRGRDSSSQPAANRMVQRTATGAIESVGQCHAKPVAERASVQPAPSERWRVQLRDRHFQSHPTATATSSPLPSLARGEGQGEGSRPFTPIESLRLGARMEQAEQKLAQLYRAYGEAFFDLKNASKAEAFDNQAAALNAELDALGSDAQRAIAAATEHCRAAGLRWRPPPAPLKAGLPAISGNGRVNQIIYANRSSWEFQELEKPLGFDPVHSTSIGSPRSDKPGHYDWSSYEKQWEQIRASGIPKKSCLLLFMTLHDGSWAPKWLLDRAKDDPEILHVLRPEAALSKRSTGTAQLNWWHPAVRDYAREIVSDMGRTFRSRGDYLFYEFQWEAYGPYVSTEKGTREVGYGKYAEADFRARLKKKYGDVAALNRRWGASHASFDDIQPPPDRHVVERRRADPLAAEWEAWREASYEDWCRLIYRAWKKSDPSKPVMADNSNIFRSFNMPNLADTCDLLAFHNSGRTFMPTLMLLNSISRHNGFKPIAQYENFWGIQEDHDRMYEELPRRHGTQKHIFRMTAWNTFLQVWWYAYTSAEYLTHYDGNYFDPAYALTTLRYRTAALPVYFQKFKRLQRALLESRLVAPRLCVLAPTASMRNNFPLGASQAEVYDLFWELYPRNYHFDLVHEEYFLDGRARLDDFDALVLPYAPYLDERLQGAIGKWLNAKPRLLVGIGPFGIYDELGRDSGKLVSATLSGRSLKLEFPDKNRWEWVEDPAKPGEMIETRAGPSKVLALLKPFARLRSTRGFVDKLLAQIEAATDRAACDEKNALELVLRQQGATRYLCALNPDPDNPTESVVRVKGALKSVTDLDYERGFPVTARMEEGDTVFPLRLEPGEATIIRLSP